MPTKKTKKKSTKKKQTLGEKYVDFVCDSEQYTQFAFFNDTGKPVQIRTTVLSSKDNPAEVAPKKSETLYLAHGGFVKLWDCGKFFQLLVE